MVKGSTLVLISIILILVLILFITVTSLLNPTEPLLLTCPPQECVTNIYTGIKECPTDATPMAYDPSFSVCNPPTTCTDPRTPYAVQPDGITNSSGQCAGDVCRCVRASQCPEFISAFFTYVGGNPFQGATQEIPGSSDPFAGQRLQFVSQSSFLNQANNTTSNRPLALPNTSQYYCQVPSSWLPRITGCASGVLAYIPDNPETFTPDQRPTTSVGCVIGTPCIGNQVPYWDKTDNILKCFQS